MEPEILYVCEGKPNNILEDFTQSRTHVHDHPELSIILSGEAHYEINKQHYTLKAGQMVLFKEGTPHGVIIPRQSSYYDLHIGVSHVLGSLAENINLLAEGFLIINFTDYKKIVYELCKTLSYESSQRKQDCKLMLQALTLQLFVVIVRELNTTFSSKTEHATNLGYPDKHKVVEFIIHYINENYMNEISLEMFAKDMYLSQVYISKLFKEETGHSPIHFLIKKRLSKAKELLETENLPIKVVSSKVGYEDAYHFSKLFKKYYGYPPSEIKIKAKK